MSINLHAGRTLEVSSSIIEWDMKRAGLSLIREYKLLPVDTILKLEGMEKRLADETVGKMQISNRDLSVGLEKAFTEVINKFLEVNELDIATDIISIKKDAVFVINKNIKVDTFGEYIRFVNKNKYKRYLYLKPLEFYITSDWDVDIKGLTSDAKVRNEILQAHENGIMNLIKSFLDYAEKEGMRKDKLYKFLHDFVVMYKNRELDYDYYREFSITNKYRYQFLGAETLADNIDDSMLEKVNIEYNYKTIIMPLIDVVMNY